MATLDGQISFWDVASAVQTGSIEGRNDLHVGRRESDRVTAKKIAGATYEVVWCCKFNSSVDTIFILSSSLFPFLPLQLFHQSVLHC